MLFLCGFLNVFLNVQLYNFRGLMYFLQQYLQWHPGKRISHFCVKHETFEFEFELQDFELHASLVLPHSSAILHKSCRYWR